MIGNVIVVDRALEIESKNVIGFLLLRVIKPTLEGNSFQCYFLVWKLDIFL